MKSLKSFTRTRTLYIVAAVSFTFVLAAVFTARPNLAERHNSPNPLVRSLNTTTPSILNSPTITVNSLGDGVSGGCSTGVGECTLREAIIFANASGGTINFAPGLSGTILLGSNLPPLSGDISINGPGASVLTVSGKKASQVFQVACCAPITISGLTIADANSPATPSAPSPDLVDGAGIRNEGQLTVKDCVISGNQATGDGGGIYNAFAGNLTVKDCVISGNHASREGGGIFAAAGNLTVINSTITGNRAEHNGGGIATRATLKVINTTISNNSAWGGVGGGIVSGSAEIYDSTIFQNDSLLGGGLYGSASVLNSIIAGNRAEFFDYMTGTFDGGHDCNGVVNSLGHNLIQVIDDPCSITGITTGNITGVSPMLGPLQNNGGGTLTRALLPGSPAIDAGDDSVTGAPLNLSTDQRDGDGFPRKFGSHVDIGAYEAPAASCLSPPTNMLAWFPGDDDPLDSAGSNHGTLMDAVTYETGEVGKAFRFPGDTSNPAIKSVAAVRLPVGALHQPYGALTIDAWIYPTAHGHDTSGLFIYPAGYQTSGRYGLTIFSNTDGGGYALRIKDGFLQADLRTEGLGVFQNFTQKQVSLNAWSHVAMTYDGSLVRMYLNGELIGTAPASGGISTSGNANTCPMIGNEPDGCRVQASGLNLPIGAGFVGGFGFQGRIDELEFFNRALSLAEIQSIMNAGNLGKCKPGQPTPTPTATPTPSPTVQVTVQTDPSGLGFTVDGSPFNSSQTFSWTVGSNHTISTTSPQNGAPGTRFEFENWSDGGNQTHVITVPSGDATYTANFGPEYLLTMNAGAGGSVNPPSGYYDGGSNVNISATPNGGYNFAGWTGSGSGSYSGAANPTSVTMNGPITETGSFAVAPIQTCVSPPPNMIVWYPADDPPQYGDFPVDIAGGNFATLVGGAGFGPGKVGQAFNFPGGISAVQISQGKLRQNFGAFTLDAWIYPTTSGHAAAPSAAYGLTIFSNTDGGGLALRLKDGLLQADVRTQGLGVAQTFGPPVPLNTWSHVAMTYNGSQVVMYLNGSAVGSAPASGGISTSGNMWTCPMIGNEPDSCYAQQSGFGFVGRIDEFEFFNRGLSAAEVQSIFNAGSAGKCKPGGNAAVNPLFSLPGQADAFDSWKHAAG